MLEEKSKLELPQSPHLALAVTLGLESDRDGEDEGAWISNNETNQK